jgi:hypothetical protein
MWQPTQTQGQEIITRYNNGESLIDLETDTGISRWLLTKFLCERGIEIRNSAQAVRIVGSRRLRWRYEPQPKGV